MIGFFIFAFFVMMGYAALGYGLGAYFPLFVVHFFPVAVPFIIGAYVAEFYDKDKPQTWPARVIRIIIIGWFAWMWVEICISLDKFYKTGKFPNDGQPTAPFWETMAHVAAILIATFVVYMTVSYIYKRYLRIKEAKRLEKEKLLNRLREDTMYLEKAKEFKAKFGTDSYT